MSKLTAPSAESIIEELPDTAWYAYGWFKSVTTDEDAQTVTIQAANPEGGKAITKTVPVAAVRDAWRDRRDEDMLCCGRDMLSEGFGYGCADDVDQVLQIVTYGSLVFG